MSLQLLHLCLHLLLHRSPLGLEVLLRLLPGRGLHLGHLAVQLSLYGGQVRAVVLSLPGVEIIKATIAFETTLTMLITC